MGYTEAKINNALAYHLSKVNPDAQSFVASHTDNEKTGVAVYHWPKGMENEDIIITAHPTGDSWGMHQHDYFVLNYIYSGAYFVTVGGQEHRMERDALCILQPGAAHSIRACPGTETSILLCIAAKKDLVYRSFLPLISESPLFLDFFVKCSDNRTVPRTIVFQNQHGDTIRSLFNAALVESAERDTSYGKLLECIFAGILIFLSRSYKEYATDEELSRRIGVESILKYMSLNCTTLTLEDTAEHFCYNPSYLSSLLHKETGRSFSTILREFKLERARQLLRQTDLPISMVASLAGYPHLGNFHKVFKTEYGLTPNEYRQQLAAEAAAAEAAAKTGGKS